MRVERDELQGVQDAEEAEPLRQGVRAGQVLPHLHQPQPRGQRQTQETPRGEEITLACAVVVLTLTRAQRKTQKSTPAIIVYRKTISLSKDFVDFFK